MKKKTRGRKVMSCLVVLAILIAYIAATPEPPKNIIETGKRLHQEANSRARKKMKPKTEDEWTIFHYFGISPEEIRKGATK